MPLLEYACDKCGKKMEVLFRDEPDLCFDVLCCDQLMRRLYSSFGFVVK